MSGMIWVEPRSLALYPIQLDDVICRRCALDNPTTYNIQTVTASKIQQRGRKKYLDKKREKTEWKKRERRKPHSFSLFPVVGDVELFLLISSREKKKNRHLSRFFLLFLSTANKIRVENQKTTTFSVHVRTPVSSYHSSAGYESWLFDGLLS